MVNRRSHLRIVLSLDFELIKLVFGRQLVDNRENSFKIVLVSFWRHFRLEKLLYLPISSIRIVVEFDS
jgi:hypothetical protein